MAFVKRFDDVNLYNNQTKAGEFVAADGSVRQAGIADGEGSNFKIWNKSTRIYCEPSSGEFAVSDAWKTGKP